MGIGKNHCSNLWKIKKDFYSRKWVYPFSLSKKAFSFTIIAIALSIIIIFSYNVYTGYRLKDKMGSIETRICTMNNFIKDLENDIENAIFIVGFRSLLSLEDYMMKYDKFLSKDGAPTLNNAFEEVFLQGTIDSEKMSLMTNNTFTNWTKKMKVQANKTGIILEFDIDDVTITQSEPWKVDVSVDLRIDVKDKKNTASWIIDKTFTKKINITGFVDPLYLINNNGIVNNTIRKTIVSDFSTQLPTHLLNSYYIEHTDAPSYLMRFENNLASSSYGIESLVNSQKLIDKGLLPKTRSAVDYIYYGTQITTNCNIEGMEAYNWFYLDSNHLIFYEAVCNIP